jgi:hypothetical protein
MVAVFLLVPNNLIVRIKMYLGRFRLLGNLIVDSLLNMVVIVVMEDVRELNDLGIIDTDGTSGDLIVPS